MSLFGNAVKKVLNETLSQVAYHFTDLYHLEQILDSNALRFSDIERDNDDLSGKLDKGGKYDFFFSTTRQRNSTIGYQSYIRSDVRITLNSDAINGFLHSEPIDFFYRTGDKESSKQPYTNSWSDAYDFKHLTGVESEDRVFSNKQYLIGLDKYIKRVDVLLTQKSLESPKCDTILHKLFNSNISDRTFVYDNEKDYNFQTNNTINYDEAL